VGCEREREIGEHKNYCCVHSLPPPNPEFPNEIKEFWGLDVTLEKRRLLIDAQIGKTKFYNF